MPERSEGFARQGHYSQVVTEENSYDMDYFLVITWLFPGCYLVITWLLPGARILVYLQNPCLRLHLEYTAFSKYVFTTSFETLPRTAAT